MGLFSKENLIITGIELAREVNELKKKVAKLQSENKTLEGVNEELREANTEWLERYLNDQNKIIQLEEENKKLKDQNRILYTSEQVLRKKNAELKETLNAEVETRLWQTESPTPKGYEYKVCESCTKFLGMEVKHLVRVQYRHLLP